MKNFFINFNGKNFHFLLSILEIKFMIDIQECDQKIRIWIYQKLCIPQYVIFDRLKFLFSILCSFIPYYAEPLTVFIRLPTFIGMHRYFIWWKSCATTLTNVGVYNCYRITPVVLLITFSLKWSVKMKIFMHVCMYVYIYII